MVLIIMIKTIAGLGKDVEHVEKDWAQHLEHIAGGNSPYTLEIVCHHFGIF